MNDNNIELTDFTDFETLEFGLFQIAAFRKKGQIDEHVVLIRGKQLNKTERVPVRIASECLTGSALNSATCDCHAQNQMALAMMAKENKGIFILLRQEGRGHGLFKKIMALKNKNSGDDTFTAVSRLGLPVDIRTFDIAVELLQFIRPRSIALLTANPDKVAALRASNLDVAQVAPLWIEPTPHTERHLTAKKDRGFIVSAKSAHRG